MRKGLRVCTASFTFFPTSVIIDIMEKLVLEFIKKEHIMEEAGSFVLAVSGGADSMAMTDLLLRSFPEKRFIIAHVNHGLRPEADKEEAFVRAFAEKKGVPFYVHHSDIAALAVQRKEGLEETGRRERYAFFRSLHCDRILTAHHKNDLCETMLLHLLQGSGMNGLIGIRPLHDDIGRPLLCVTKDEILQYCEKNHIDYCFDSSNKDTAFTRNRIREELLPLMNTYHGNITEILYRLSRTVSEDETFLEDYTQKRLASLCEEYNGTVILNAEKLEKEPLAIRRRIIKEICNKKEIRMDIDRVDAVLSLKNGKKIPLNKELWIKREQNGFRIEKRSEKTKNTEEIPLVFDGITFFDTVTVTAATVNTPFFSKDPFSVCVPARLVKDKTPVLRHRKAGDYIILPDGGRKKLSDCFIDDKVPADERDSIVLLAVNQQVLWAVGHRKYVSLPENPTENLLYLKAQKKQTCF